MILKVMTMTNYNFNSNGNSNNNNKNNGSDNSQASNIDNNGKNKNDSGRRGPNFFMINENHCCKNRKITMQEFSLQAMEVHIFKIHGTMILKMKKMLSCKVKKKMTTGAQKTHWKGKRGKKFTSDDDVSECGPV